jgi:hypothetical protein
LETIMSDPTAAVLGLTLEGPSLSPAGLSHDTIHGDPTATLPAREAEPAAKVEAAAAPAEAEAVTAVPVIPIAFRMVSGRYVATTGSFRVELRVDVDRAHAMNKVSGDFFTVSGSTVTYFGSFIVKAPVITTFNRPRQPHCTSQPPAAPRVRPMSAASRQLTSAPCGSRPTACPTS